MYCSKCGRELPPGVSACPVCSQADNQTASQPVRRETKQYGYLKSQQTSSIISSLVILVIIFWIWGNAYEFLDSLGVDVYYSDVSSFRACLLLMGAVILIYDVFHYVTMQKVFLEVGPDYIQGNGVKSFVVPSTQSFKLSYSELSETRFMFNAASGILQIPLHGGWISLPIENSVEARNLIEERRVAAGAP